MPNAPLASAMERFTDTDNAWDAELRLIYGRKSGDARYDPRRNRATLELARLAGERDRAQTVYHEQMDRWLQRQRVSIR